MKRTFLARRNALLSGAGARLGVAVVALICVAVAVRFIFPNTLLAAEVPVLRLSDSLSASVANLFSGFDNASKLVSGERALATQNTTLQEQNAVLTAKVADLEQLLGSAPSMAPGVIAGVLARPPETAYDTLVVAAGASNGVAAGDVAYAISGIPVGVVAAVSASAARVTLLSASDEVTPAWVGAARMPITLLGEGGGAFLAQAPRAASTSVGELVYVSGPSALPIGKVAAVSGDPSSPFITLDISGVVNIFSLPYVLIEHTGPSTWPAGAPVATTTAP